MKEKIKELYEMISFVLGGKVHFYFALVFLLLVIILGIYFLIPKSNSESVIDSDEENIEDVVIDQPEIQVEPQQNPELTEEQKTSLCTNKANSELGENYKFVWEGSTTTQYSKTEESHQLKGYYDLKDEKSILVQCMIESGRFKDSDVKVSFLPSEYYSREKFLAYKTYCEELGGYLKGQSGYGHGMIGNCGFDDGSSCDLREFYRGNCRKGFNK